MDFFGTLILISAFVGVPAHQHYFSHGEHDFSTAFYMRSLGIVLTFGPPLIHTFLGIPVRSAFLGVTSSCVSFVLSVLLNMTLYRLIFHRLKSFPGPVTWRISKLVQCWANSDLKSYRHLHTLHEQYGQFVRTGPTELSIIHPDATRAILGPASKCTKSLWYDMSLPLKTMHQCRDKSTHDFRRRIWDRGFSRKALRAYEPVVAQYTDLLVQRVRELVGQPMNVTKWMHYYSFDIMGDLAFGNSFGMLRDGKAHFAIEYLFDYMRPMGTMIPAPWFFEIVKMIPGGGVSAKRFVAWCRAQVDSRAKQSTERQDIMSWLLQAPSRTNDADEDYEWLTGDARLIVVAGSDTVAAVLAFAIFEILKHPAYINALRDELDPLADGPGLTASTLAKDAPLLNGIISEALRMHPALLSGLLRKTPPEGVSVGDTFVPGDITVCVPFYSLQRSPGSFTEPDSFIPERWTTQPELVLHPEAYAPFSAGKYNCIGKQLALMEMRAVLAHVISSFDMDFARGEDGTALIDDLEDHFTISPGDMWVSFRPRKGH